MNFEASHKTIKTVFSGDKKYIIPRFQREYSWGKEELSELWIDVLSCIYEKDGELKTTDYFIGTLVLIGNENQDQLQVIDGQQRLTTLTILISALVEKFKDSSSMNNAKGLYKYIEGTDLEDKKFFKLVNEVSKPFLQTTIQNFDKTNKEPDEQEKVALLDAYEFFIKKLSYDNLKNDFSSKINAEVEYIKLLEIVRDQVLNLGVIFVTADSEDGAYDIFETLNARGLGLSTVDLIKNDLFRTMTTEHPDDFAKTSWKEVRENLGEGKNSINFDTFFRHFWLSKYEYRTENRIYKSFRAFKIQKKIEAKEFLESLLEESVNYSKITNPNFEDWKSFNGKKIYRSLEAVNRFKLTQVRTLLMSFLYLFERKIITVKELENGLELIEKFHFLFSTICSMRPSGLEIKYSSIARKVRDIKAKADFKIILQELKQNYQSKLPDQSHFFSKLGELKYTNNRTKDSWVIKYIFDNIEYHLRGNGEVELSDCSIEHIAPQSTKDDSLKKVVGTLGNLILLDRGLNVDAGSKSFENKIHYYKQSSLKHVSRFVDRYEKSLWDKNQIEERQVKLAEELWGIFSNPVLK